MIFLNIKLPESISYLSEGGPRFLTNISSSNNLYEYRSQKILEPTMIYKIHYSKLNKYMIQELISFFYITKGRRYSFRFKDFLDFEVVIQNKNNNTKNIYKNYIVIEKNISYNNIVWAFCIQLQKNYVFNNIVYSKKITKPIASTIKFFNNDDEFNIENKFEIDENKGLLYIEKEFDINNFDIEFEFDTCVRFNSDLLMISNIYNGVFDSKNIELIEVKNE
jgi:uncharacterized protein (TIGR02217 family)